MKNYETTSASTRGSNRWSRNALDFTKSARVERDFGLNVPIHPRKADPERLVDIVFSVTNIGQEIEQSKVGSTGL